MAFISKIFFQDALSCSLSHVRWFSVAEAGRSLHHQCVPVGFPRDKTLLLWAHLFILPIIPENARHWISYFCPATLLPTCFKEDEETALKKNYKNPSATSSPSTVHAQKQGQGESFHCIALQNVFHPKLAFLCLSEMCFLHFHLGWSMHRHISKVEEADCYVRLSSSPSSSFSNIRGGLHVTVPSDLPQKDAYRFASENAARQAVILFALTCLQDHSTCGKPITGWG